MRERERERERERSESGVMEEPVCGSVLRITEEELKLHPDVQTKLTTRVTWG
jgi:hypothetical protein